MAPTRWIWSNSLQPFSRRKEEAGGGGEQIPLTLIGSRLLVPFNTHWNISMLASVPSLDFGVETANKDRTRSSPTEIIIFWSRHMKDFYIVTGRWLYAMKGGTSLAYSLCFGKHSVQTSRYLCMRTQKQLSHDSYLYINRQKKSPYLKYFPSAQADIKAQTAAPTRMPLVHLPQAPFSRAVASSPQRPSADPSTSELCTGFEKSCANSHTHLVPHLKGAAALLSSLLPAEACRNAPCHEEHLHRQPQGGSKWAQLSFSPVWGSQRSNSPRVCQLPVISHESCSPDKLRGMYHAPLTACHTQASTPLPLSCAHTVLYTQVNVWIRSTLYQPAQFSSQVRWHFASLPLSVRGCLHSTSARWQCSMPGDSPATTLMHHPPLLPSLGHFSIKFHTSSLLLPKGTRKNLLKTNKQTPLIS